MQFAAQATPWDEPEAALEKYELDEKVNEYSGKLLERN